jgi:serine/threonine protein kinase/tetratricopeptide (TPR) repeat protein
MSNLSAVESIYFAALDKGSPEERAAYLDQACGPDREVRGCVERLLKAQPRVGEFLQAPAPGLAGTVDEPPLMEKPGVMVGPYKLKEQIGEGGMGLVFVAEQQHPVRRRVALKIIKPGMDSAQVVARFEQERQALAMMDHQNIAKVHDAGTTESGRPYFVMELVHGVPITEYCDANKLTPRQRLELFVPVCQAIQHAHQKGIIHRDIKPSNVLVTMYDDKPVPKVIDFGVAKAVEQRLTEKSVYTQFGTLVGTFEYMSPEQAEMNAFGVDTRSDIYALGVLLYELLTGTTPLERQRLREAAFDEIRRIIKEEEPQRPSVRLSTSGALAKVAAARKTDPGKLSRLLRGELDWVVMKCLEKDRSRRYDTATGLAKDVERYLKDEPVEARPPTVGYRFRKMARRNMVALTTAALVVAALLLGTVASTWQAVRATRAEADARAAEDKATKERDRAEAEKASAQATLRFILADVLEHAGPFREANRNLTVRALLDKVTDRLEKNADLPPLTEAAIRQTAGRIYWSLGELKQARSLLARSYKLQRQHAGEDAPDTLDAAFYLALVYRSQSDFAKAEPLYLRVIDGRRRLYRDDHRETLLAVDGLAQLCNFRGEFDRAVALYVPALEASRKAHGDQDPVTLRLMAGLGCTYSGSGGRPDKAEPLLASALKGQQVVLKDKHPETLVTRQVLAIILLRLNRLPEAEQQARQAYEDMQTVYGEMHPYTYTGQATLINVYLAQGRRNDAAPLVRNLLTNARRHQEKMPVFALGGIGAVGHALLRERDFVEAESFLRVYLELAAKQTSDARDTSAAESALGACLLGQKKYKEAEELLLSGYNGLRKHEDKIPANFRQIQLTEALERLVQLYQAWDRPTEAARWRKELEAAKKAAKPAASP